MAEVAGGAVRGSQRNGVKRREQIVETASDVFAEFGYAGGSIRTIAARVGVAPATLIQHFGSKEGLLEAVLDDWCRQTEQLDWHGFRGLAYFRALRELMEFHLEHRGLIELFLTMTAEASSPIHPARAFIQRRYSYTLELFGMHLTEARDLGEIAQLSNEEIEYQARLITAVLDGLELQWLLDPTTDLVGDTTRYVDDAVGRWQSARPR